MNLTPASYTGPSTQQWPAEVKASQRCGSQENTSGQTGTNQNMWNCSVGLPCSMSVSHMIIINTESEFLLHLVAKSLHIFHRDGKVFDLILQNCLWKNNDSLEAHCTVLNNYIVNWCDITKPQTLHVQLPTWMSSQSPQKEYGTNMLCSFQPWQRCFQFGKSLMYRSSPADHAWPIIPGIWSTKLSHR